MSMSQDKVPLGELPVASTSLDEEVESAFDGGTLTLSFVYTTEHLTYHSRVRFFGVRAHRHRAERFCTEWEIKDAYDTIVEVEDSRWVTELQAVARDLGQVVSPLRQFMIYIDSAGCFEAVGVDWELTSPERVG